MESRPTPKAEDGENESMMTLRSKAPLVVVIAAVVGVWACSSNEAPKPAVSADPKAPAGIDETLTHEKCDASMGRAEVVDANNDSKPDITLIVDKANKNVCRVTDLNHDGKPEMYEFWDDAGNLRRRELSFENSDAVTAIEIYKGGKLSERMLDTTGQRRVDTWDHYDDSGRRTKRERDTTNTGRIDQWWVFNADGTVTISVDKNGDGQPDPENTITVTAAGVAVSADAGAPAPSASAPVGDAGAALTSPAPPVIYPDGVTTVVDAGAPGGKKRRGTK